MTQRSIRTILKRSISHTFETMSAHITNFMLVPPGGWWYRQPESGFKMTAFDPLSLKRQIEQHRRANGYDLADGWWEVVQAEICERPGMMQSHCQPDTTFTAEQPIRITRNSALLFFKTLRQWVVRNGFKKVTVREAVRRSKICGECPMNSDDVAWCPGCQGIFRYLKEFLTPADKTGRELTLHFCKVCGCNLQIKVWLPPETLKAVSSPQTEYPAHCWIAKIEKDR